MSRRIPPAYLIAALGLPLGVTGLIFKITRVGPLAFDPVLDLVTDGLAGFLLLGCGVFAHARRPANRVGLLMVLLGVALFAEDIQLSVTPWVKLVGLPFTMVAVGSAVHLALAFPTGELGARHQKILVGIGYAISLGIFPVIRILLDGHYGVNADPARFDLGLLAVETARIGLAVAVFFVLLTRWHTATPPVRRLLTPMFMVGIPGGAAEIVVNAPLVPQATPVGVAANLVGRVAVTLFPILFLVGVLRARTGCTVVAGMLTRLGEATSTADLQTLLGRTLGDPSLQIGYWRGGLVDAHGAPLSLPDNDGRRAVTVVTWDGREVAALVHDAAVSENRHVLEAAASAAGLALEHQRLITEVRTRLAEVRASRARISEAADAERHRVERDLHDGAQQRIVTAALTFQLVSERLAGDADPELAVLLKAGTDDLTTALRELRDLARGIHPAVLTEAGLVAALKALAELARLPVAIIADPLPPLPSVVEVSAYFVAAEALTNAAKHAGASQARITVSHTDAQLRVEIDDNGVGGAQVVAGGGLAGLTDRVAAAGGELVVCSPPGAGTHLVACLPTGDERQTR